MIPIILIVTLCVSLYYYYFHPRISYWKRHQIPFIPMKFPYIFGNISSNKHKALQFADFCNDHPEHPIFGIFVFFQPALIVTSLPIIRDILNRSFDHFQNRGMYHNDPLSAILGSLDHDDWQPLRKQISPAFTPAKIKNMFEIVKTVGEKLEKGLSETISSTNQVEIRDLFGRFTTDVIGSVAIGIECNTLNSKNELRDMAKKAMQTRLTFPRNILTETHPSIARFFNVRKHSKEVTDFFLNIVKESVEFRQQSGEKRNDYLQLLIEAKLPIERTAALAFDFLSAGYADSTSTLAYCMYELSLPQNQHIQREARREIQSVLEDDDGELTYEGLKKMVYCKQIIDGNKTCGKKSKKTKTLLLNFFCRNFTKTSGGWKRDESMQ